MDSVLFVSHSKRGAFYYNDASARYRCVFPAEHLNELGTLCHVIHFTQLGKITLQNYSHIIFHRPQFSLKLKYYMGKIKRLNIRAIADFDDLLFEPKLALHSPAVLSGYMSLNLAKKHARSYKKALLLFTNAWVSTELLAKQMKISQPNIIVTICHNKVPIRWAELQPTTSVSDRVQNKIIRYMPGTSHHSHDFEKIEVTLATLLAKNPDIHLDVVGDLTFNIENFPKGQISRQKHMPFEQLPEVIASSWLTLAPLQKNTFNECKSGLKFWESGLYGVPVISSTLKDISRFNNPGLHISDNLELWLVFIEKMKNPINYQQASESSHSSASAAVFGKSETDTRLGFVGAKTTICPPLNINRNQQQLFMCAKFGPRWPSIILDPTHTQYKNAKQLATDNLLFNTNLSESTLRQLKNEGACKIAQDGPTQKHILKRKLSKLWLSPADFFKDMRIINR